MHPIIFYFLYLCNPLFSILYIYAIHYSLFFIFMHPLILIFFIFRHPLIIFYFFFIFRHPIILKSFIFLFPSSKKAWILNICFSTEQIIRFWHLTFYSNSFLFDLMEMLKRTLMLFLTHDINLDKSEIENMSYISISYFTSYT